MGAAFEGLPRATPFLHNVRVSCLPQHFVDVFDLALDSGNLGPVWILLCLLGDPNGG
jgi:hypothetical protein